jgi:hypothetical protein
LRRHKRHIAKQLVHFFVYAPFEVFYVSLVIISLLPPRVKLFLKKCEWQTKISYAPVAAVFVRTPFECFAACENKYIVILLKTN